MEYASAYRLAEEIRSSEECRTLKELKEQAMGDETQAALIRESRKLQVQLQMGALSGAQAQEDEVQRFSAISTLLFSKPETRDYLLAEMRMQQTLADVIKIITEATGLEMQLPGAEG